MPIFRAVREMTLVKDSVCSCKQCVYGVHKQKVALIARGNSYICHKLRLESHLVSSSCGREVDKGSTVKYMWMINDEHLPLKHFMGGAPFEASYWCMVVEWVV